jgi:hypothetical protein
MQNQKNKNLLQTFFTNIAESCQQRMADIPENTIFYFLNVTKKQPTAPSTGQYAREY